MEQKDYKKLLRKIQLSANMFIDRNGFAGWVYSMIATELDENAHWNFIETDKLEEFSKEIEKELRRRRGDEEDKKQEEPVPKLPVKTRKSLKGAKIYPPAPAVMKIVTARVAKELEGFSDAFKVRDEIRAKAKKDLEVLQKPDAKAKVARVLKAKGKTKKTKKKSKK